jgi:hypothetical protein
MDPVEDSSVNTAVEVAVLASLGIAAVAFLVGVARVRRAADMSGTGQPPAATDLMSDFEVSRAIGVSVEARGTRTEAAYHPERGGDLLLQVSVLAGRSARAAMRAHRRDGRPLPHAGDEALSGDGWVLGRRGDVVVLMRQHDLTRWRVIGGLPWLLSTALIRVPTTGADLYR